VPLAGSGSSTFAIERNGINVISESERHGQPHDLFWPWCAANISCSALSYGSFVLAFGSMAGKASLPASSVWSCRSCW
jgi:hypothetical protein